MEAGKEFYQVGGEFGIKMLRAYSINLTGCPLGK
jgi:hypothetical protein